LLLRLNQPVVVNALQPPVTWLAAKTSQASSATSTAAVARLNQLLKLSESMGNYCSNKSINQSNLLLK
jgi:hypothetical protein